MLIMADGSYLGLLSGGCMEADLASHAGQVIEAGVPRAIEYDMRGPDDVLFGLGAGCEGAMRILLEPRTAATVQLCDPRRLRSVIPVERCHAAVIMSHHLVSDAQYLRELAQAGVPAYIGLLGPQARRTRLARELAPVAGKLRSRVYGPVGSDIGAVTPEGIALAIVGQIHAWLAGRDGILPAAL
jgi:xanthine/CO dehydrogenase XdhC/CoxF family maturation factor